MQRQRGGAIMGLIVPVLLFVALAGVVFRASMAVDEHSCKETAAQMGVPYQWGVYTNCMIKVDGKWIPLNAYRVEGAEHD